MNLEMTDVKFLVNCSLPTNFLNENLTEADFVTKSSVDVVKSVEVKAVIIILVSVVINVVLHYSYCKRPDLSYYTSIFNKKTVKRTVTLLGLVLSLPLVTLLLVLALCYKVLCTGIIWRKDKYFVGLLNSFDIFWSLEDEATINVLGVIESDSPESLVYNIKKKLQNLILSQAVMEKIFYRRNEEYGFYYWRKYKSIDVDRYVELLEFPEKDGLSVVELQDIMSTVSYQSLPYNNEGLFKIYVTKQRIGNNDNERGKYGIIFIIHHSVGDGVALLDFLCKAFADNTEKDTVNMFVVPEAKCYTSPGALLDMIQKLFQIPMCFADTILRKPDNNDLHGPSLLREKSFMWTQSDENLLQMVKEIKENVRNASFSDVLATALSGGMHDFYTKTKSHVPEELGVILPVRFAKSSLPVNSRHFLKNDFSVTLLDLPIKGERSFSEVKKKCDKLRRSADPLCNHYFIKIVSLLPKNLLKPMLYSNQATMVFSNMPGPDLMTICGGNALKELVFFLPHKGNTGLDVTALCYGGVLRLAASADKAIISCPEHLAYILDGMVEEIKRLHRLYVDKK